MGRTNVQENRLLEKSLQAYSCHMEFCGWICENHLRAAHQFSYKKWASILETCSLTLSGNIRDRFSSFTLENFKSKHLKQRWTFHLAQLTYSQATHGQIWLDVQGRAWQNATRLLWREKIGCLCWENERLQSKTDQVFEQRPTKIG